MLAVALPLAACSDDADYLEDVFGSSSEGREETLKVTDIRFSDDYKTFYVDTRLMESIGALNLADRDEVQVVAKEYDYVGDPVFNLSQPTLKEIVSLGAAQVVAHDLKMLVLVDLTLPQSVVDKERDAVKEMSTLFTNNNLFVAFITRRHEVSGIMAPSKYVLDNYFKAVQVDDKNLLPSVSKGLNLLSDEDGPFSDVSERVLLVLSEGDLFEDNNYSISKDYFKEKEELLRQSLETQTRHLLFFVDMNRMEEDENPGDIGTFMTTICRNTGGESYQDFNWVKIEDDLFTRLKINYSDYRFKFENPDNKLYSGFGKTLKIECFHDGELVTSGSIFIQLGSFLSPVVVNEDSNFVVIARGLIYSFAVSAIVFLVLLLVVPAVRYRIFKHKYVAKYTDSNMSLNGIIVGDTCYYCKAPFVQGEEVVAKCQHTMHKSCWDENGYHCPEYGRYCRNGSHYYNSVDKLDMRNAQYYLKWVMLAIAGALGMWLIYMRSDKISEPKILLSIAEKVGTPIDNLSFMYPSYGMGLAFVLTALFCLVSIPRFDWKRRFGEIFVRSAVAGLLGWSFFFLGALLIILLHGEFAETIFFNWLPWCMCSVAIAICCTFRTNYKVKLKSFFVIVAISVVLVVLLSFLFLKFSLEYRPYMLLAFALFATGIAIGIAQAAPVSERFFLHATGAIKEMDIALYKWFSSNPDAVVSIGKSVDCSIEMSWDIAPGIGPRQAEIRMCDGVPYLFAVDDGVTVKGRRMKPEDKLRLYHGRTFRIGNTEFTYQERDI